MTYRSLQLDELIPGNLYRITHHLKVKFTVGSRKKCLSQGRDNMELILLFPEEIIAGVFLKLKQMSYRKDILRRSETYAEFLVNGDILTTQPSAHIITELEYENECV